MAEKNLVIGLDIGTTKICSIIGELRDEGQVEVVGVGTSPSTGLRKGMVVNIDATIHSIERAVEEAELMAGVKVKSLYAGIAGGHIKGINSRGVIAISRKDREISAEDIDRVIDAAKAVAIPLDREVIHVLSQSFTVDDQDGIKDPIGMSGIRLEAEIHIVTGAVTAVQNIIKSVNRAGFEVEDIILQPLASAEAVLTPDEKELGVAILDIGGGTTDIAIFHEGSIRHTCVLPLGGDHVTNDIAVGLRTPTSEAENIKKKFGCALASLVREEEEVEVPSVGGRQARRIFRRVLCEIVEPRLEEIYTLVKREIKMAGYEDLLAAGIVITGGTSLMDGSLEIAEKIFGLPVRRGYPTGIGGLVDVVNNPIYSTGVGLVLCGAQNLMANSSGRFSGDGIFGRVLGRMRSWLSEYF